MSRQGIQLEQCQGCSGIFLDRGELEQIIAAEKRHYGAAPPPYTPPVGHAPHPGHHGGYPDSPRGHRGGYPDSPRGYRDGYPDSPRGYRGGYSDSPGPYGRRRKKSFLENLFD